MMVPNPENPDAYTLYVWNEEIKQWLLDQKENGIPEECEETNDSNDQSSSDNDSGSTSEGSGGDELPEGVF